MTVRGQLVIDGVRLDGAAGWYDVHNPARPAEVVGHGPAADTAQLDLAVAAARRAAPQWASLTVAERLALVVAATEAAAASAADADLATTYTREHGKVRSEAEFEFVTAPALAQVLGMMAEDALAPELVEPPAAYPRLQREPYGVAALIIPFNWPVAVTMMKVTSALVAGNTAVVKVPPTVPLALLEFGAVLAAGLPHGVVNLLAGPGADLSRALVAHRGIDVISLTGGVATGRAVMTAAAERLTPVLLELGGNDAAIVAPDQQITEALAEDLFAATYTTGGQVCMAVKRLYCPRDRVAELADALLARCDREIVGDGLAPDTTLGPMHTAAGRDRVTAMLDAAAAAGATVRTGGRLREDDADSGGYFVLPTVVTGAPADAAIVADEQFGPVVPILGYDDLDEAVDAANATEFGLTASVWTGDEALGDDIASRLIAGSVSINAHGMAAQDPRLPFGGVGQSGVGRELGADGLRAFTRPRSLIRRPPR
ncbi:MAG TPA: aldehyde dehydrogenase family protein [Mycobacteriales bacterium]|nr:aldehyde dehydrogenase family protein [Mycobacteriales bacterium]HWB68012.1 aldehyde dehydrogenase family protein [Mycobacteriales bacterium]